MSLGILKDKLEKVISLDEEELRFCQIGEPEINLILDMIRDDSYWFEEARDLQETIKEISLNLSKQR